MTCRSAESRVTFLLGRIRALLYAGKPNWDLLATIPPLTSEEPLISFFGRSKHSQPTFVIPELLCYEPILEFQVIGSDEYTRIVTDLREFAFDRIAGLPVQWNRIVGFPSLPVDRQVRIRTALVLQYCC